MIILFWLFSLVIEMIHGGRRWNEELRLKYQTTGFILNHATTHKINDNTTQHHKHLIVVVKVFLQLRMTGSGVSKYFNLGVQKITMTT